MSNIIKEVKLYNGDVTVQKREGRFGHEYWVKDGNTDFERKTGVTTFLSIKDKSRPLIIWATRLAQDYLLQRVPGGVTPDDVLTACKLHSTEKEKAANIGTEIHDWIENLIKRRNPPMPENPNVIRGVASFLEWKHSHKVKFTASEEIIYSRKYDYCGSLDFEAEINGKKYLGDFKTGNALYNEVLMQTAAYAMARQEESGIEYDGRYLLRVAKETEQEFEIRNQDKDQSRLEPYQIFEAVPVAKDMRADFKAFLAFQQGYNWNKEAEKRLKTLKSKTSPEAQNRPWDER